MILRRLLAVLAAIIYTLLYGIPYSRFVFNFLAGLDRHGYGLVSSADLRALQVLTAVFLHVCLVVIIVCMYKKLRGVLVYAYLASLVTPFFMPLVFMDMRSGGFISFSWQFDGAVWVVVNFIAGPAMVLMVGCFAVWVVGRWRGAVKPRKFAA